MSRETSTLFHRICGFFKPTEKPVGIGERLVRTEVAWSQLDHTQGNRQSLFMVAQCIRKSTLAVLEWNLIAASRFGVLQVLLCTFNPTTIAGERPIDLEACKGTNEICFGKGAIDPQR